MRRDEFARSGDPGRYRYLCDDGVIWESDVVADFTDLQGGRFTRQSTDEITLFKNGGGAHLDLMVARYILERWQAG